MDITKKPIYPLEPWNITEEEFKVQNNYRNETTFALSNGYIGTRGTFEEAYPFDVDTGLEGNFVNGFYESEDIRYGEANFGSPLKSQSLLNLPNMKGIRMFLDEEEFSLVDAGDSQELSIHAVENGKKCVEQSKRVGNYKRSLDMKSGILERSLIWTTKSGLQAELHIKRLVSFAYKNIMAIQYSVKLLGDSKTAPKSRIRFSSGLQADVENHTRKTNPIVDYGPFGRRLEKEKLWASGEVLFYQGKTKGSGLTLGCGCSHGVNVETAVSGATKSTVDSRENSAAESTVDSATNQKYENLQFEHFIQELHGDLDCSLEILPGQTVTLEKYICYTSNLDMEASKLEDFVADQLAQAKVEGFAGLEEKQRTYLSDFWDVADVEVEGDTALEQGMRFNMFHIMQSAGRDGRTGMGAKGLSGEGYEGHYFWDTEMYVLPVLIYTEPELARKLLDYRYGTLPQARDRARILGHPAGALFPWRTINGQEASTYYPLGTAQYHINADIAYALSLYISVTGDRQYLVDKGAEILIETARVWADVGSFVKYKGGKYCICDVTGPDEYNVLVDNNFYTNLMARENLRDAKRAVEYLDKNAPGKLQELEEKLDFDLKELEYWQKIIDNMYFPYDEERQIYPLDDGFMMRKPWDEERIPKEKRAWLYENYHPLFIMRHRMSKQADSMIGLYLYSNYFSREDIRRNYDFYQEVTLHHSSLSTCIFGIVACSIGYYDEAYEYFAQSARMDLDDYHNNFYAGIHAANMAGTWQAMINGFAGLRCQGDKLCFCPYLPEKWTSYAFKVRYRGALLGVKVLRDKAVFTLLKGEPVTFYLGFLQDPDVEGNQDACTEVVLHKVGETYESRL